LVKIVWKKNLIITIAVTGLIVLGSGGLSYWIYGVCDKARQDEENFKSQVSTFKVKRDRIPSLEKEVIMLRESVKEYVKILPDESKVNDFADSLSGFAAESEVYFTKLEDSTTRGKLKKKEVFDRTIFHINLKGNIFQLLKFVSLIEDYERFIRISDISITAGDYDAENSLRSEVMHECSLKVETFIYNSNIGGGGLTKIQNYDKKREQLLSEIRSTRNEIKIERYDYVYKSSIRDPFIDPRSPIGADKSGGSSLAIEDQKAFIEGLGDKIFEIKSLLDTVKSSTNIALIRRMELQSEVAERISELSTEIKKSVEEEWISDPACKKLEALALADWDKLLKEEEVLKNKSIPTISSKELASIKEEMEDLYLAKNYEECQKPYKILEGKLDRALVEAIEMDKEKSALYHDIQNLCVMAENSDKFDREVTIKISGIIYQPGNSVAIINRRVLKVGEYLQDNLYIEGIEENEIILNFNGQTFRMKYIKDGDIR